MSGSISNHHLKKPDLCGFSLLDVTGIGIQGPKDFHRLVVPRLRGEHFLKALSSIFRVPPGDVHLPEAKVREDVATGGKLSGLL